MMFALFTRPWIALGAALGAALVLVIVFVQVESGVSLLLVFFGLAALTWLASGPYTAWLGPKLAGRHIVWKFSFLSFSSGIKMMKLEVIIFGFLAPILSVLSAFFFFVLDIGSPFPSSALAIFALVFSSMSLGFMYAIKRMEPGS